MYAETVDQMELRDQITMKYHLSSKVQLKMLKYSENINYSVYDSVSSEKYVLRLCKPGYHSKQELESEMLWIAKIKDETDIIVADPIAGKNQDYVQMIQLTEVTEKQQSVETFYCCMFTFLSGVNLREICENNRLAEYNESIGEITAKFHKQAENWKDANKLTRFSWGYDDLMGERARWGGWQEYKGLTDEQVKLYQRTETIIHKRLDHYGKAKDRYGLIHTDLNTNNIIVDGEKIQVLDFDDCGYGWFLYDCGTTLLEYEDNLDEMLHAWLKGYQKIRKLSNEDKAEIMTFVMLRKLVRIAWVASHYDNDTVKKIPASFYTNTEQLAKRYCRNQGRINLCERN